MILLCWVRCKTSEDILAWRPADVYSTTTLLSLFGFANSLFVTTGDKNSYLTIMAANDHNLETQQYGTNGTIDRGGAGAGAAVGGQTISDANLDAALAELSIVGSNMNVNVKGGKGRRSVGG